MKTLRQHLKESGETQAQFASRVGLSQSYINEISRGMKTPRLPVALKIVAATGGAVDLSSLIATEAT